MDEQDLGDWDDEFLDEAFKAEDEAFKAEDEAFKAEDKAIKAKELYLPTQLPPSVPAILPAPAPVPSMATVSSSLSHAVQLQSTGKTPVCDPFVSHSPPRALSQRVGVFTDVSTVATVKPISPTSSTRRYDNEKDLEIDRLKKELERVSKNFLDREQECSQLRKEKSKETQSKNSHTENKGHVATLHSSKRANLEPDVATSVNHRENNSATVLDDKRSM